MKKQIVLSVRTELTPAAAEHLRNQLNNAVACTWTQTEDGDFQAGCSEMVLQQEKSPRDVGMKYCPFCGRTIHLSGKTG